MRVWNDNLGHWVETAPVAAPLVDDEGIAVTVAAQRSRVIPREEPPNYSDHNILTRRMPRE